MATFKAEVYQHQKKADGTYNIKIRVIHNRKKRYLSTVWFVEREDLTRSGKIKNQKYIDLTDDLIRKYRSICDMAGERLKSMTVDEVVKLITTSRTETFELDIVAYARKYIQELSDQGRIGNAKTYKVAIDALVKWIKREKVGVNEITVKFIQEWIKHLQETTKGRAASLYPSVLRAIHNRAKREFNDEEAGVINIPYSPFKNVDLPKVPVARQRAITVEQLQALAKIPYRMIMQPGTNRFNLAKDVFLLSFLLIGINAVDLYTCTSLKAGRLTYERTKTKNRRSDRAEISIKVPPEAEALVAKYKDPSGERVFNFYKLYSSMDTFSAAINKGLKKIGELIGVDDLEYYAARHTWATIARNEAGVDKYTVHAALNHVDDNMRVTDLYIKKSWDPLDKANRQVLDYVKLEIGSVKEEIYVPKRLRGSE